MKATSKKAILETLSNGLVNATMIGGQCSEDWSEIVKQIKQAHPDARETPSSIYFGASGGTERFVMKPKFTRIRVGRLLVSGAKYLFSWDDCESEGHVADLKVGETGDSLVLKMAGDGQSMVYRLQVA